MAMESLIITGKVGLIGDDNFRDHGHLTAEFEQKINKILNEFDLKLGKISNVTKWLWHFERSKNSKFLTRIEARAGIALRVKIP